MQLPFCRYYSPYPEPYCGCEKLYVCEYTMKYFRKPKSLERHLAKLQTRQPPGALVALELIIIHQGLVHLVRAQVPKAPPRKAADATAAWCAFLQNRRAAMVH